MVADYFLNLILQGVAEGMVERPIYVQPFPTLVAGTLRKSKPVAYGCDMLLHTLVAEYVSATSKGRHPAFLILLVAYLASHISFPLDNLHLSVGPIVP